jgi:hypothetical protein
MALLCPHDKKYHFLERLTVKMDAFRSPKYSCTKLNAIKPRVSKIISEKYKVMNFVMVFINIAVVQLLECLMISINPDRTIQNFYIASSLGFRCYFTYLCVWTMVIVFVNNTDTSWNAEILLLVILLPVVFIMTVASLCMYSYHRNGKIFRHKQRCQHVEVSKYITTEEIAQMQ